MRQQVPAGFLFRCIGIVPILVKSAFGIIGTSVASAGAPVPPFALEGRILGTGNGAVPPQLAVLVCFALNGRAYLLFKVRCSAISLPIVELFLQMVFAMDVLVDPFSTPFWIILRSS